jgi:hypothetical protein
VLANSSSSSVQSTLNRMVLTLDVYSTCSKAQPMSEVLSVVSNLHHPKSSKWNGILESKAGLPTSMQTHLRSSTCIAVGLAMQRWIRILDRFLKLRTNIPEAEITHNLLDLGFGPESFGVCPEIS